MACKCKKHNKNYILKKHPKTVKSAKKIVTLLGEDLTNASVAETPQRFVSALMEMTWGLREDEDKFLQGLATHFEVGYKEMVAIKTINFVSLCQHHLLPFLGFVNIAYIPSEDKVLGLSKLARLVTFYAARPQTQERMTHQIAEGLAKILPVEGVGVKIEAEHLCMSIRGTRASGAVTVTSTLTGPFLNDQSTRNEFLNL